MRSSIACSRCRRSKIKCVNAGIDTTCRACESSGRECVYPTPALSVGGHAAKRDLAATGDGDDRHGDWDSPKRQRSRKAMGASAPSAKEMAKANADVLDSSVLTLKVWESLFDIFQLHFATILPFLHPTTFLNQIRVVSASQQEGQTNGDTAQSPIPRVEASPLIMLGVLALTARFHPQLAAYHSPPSSVNPSDPLVSSEFYASALRARLAGPDGLNLADPGIHRIQALLMLALHEWGMCRGKNAWVYVGIAIRISQAMGLPYELEHDEVSRAHSSSPVLTTEAEHFGLATKRRESREQNSDDVIEQETKRRTFWGCFLMDRCLSSGKYRPRMIEVRDLGIQLPSDNAFAFGERVRTSRLCDGPGRRPPSFDGPNGQIPGLRQSISYGDEKLRPNGTPRSDPGENYIDRWEIGAEECVLSRVIRIMRIWGSVAKWSCAGGRRTEQHPPWHPESRFYHLRNMLADFQDGLSRNLQYTPRNTDTHIMYKNTLAPYTLMHTVYFLSVIVLHRSYVPFLPLRSNEPEGPRDEPIFSPDRYQIPDGFWRESAKELFRAARQMMDLVKTCHERGVLVESPVVGFAIYNAAFIGVYAAHFTHMDQEGQMCSKPTSSDVVPGMGSSGQVAARKGIEILGSMRPRLKMAVGWFRTIHRLHTYFSKVKRDFKRNAQKMDSISLDGTAHQNGRNISLRDGGFGGGYEEFKLLEKLLLDFGSMEDQAPEMANGPEEDGVVGGHVSERMAGSSDAGSNAIKSESGDVESHGEGRRESWVPINSPVHGMITSSASDGDANAISQANNTASNFDRRPSLPFPPTGRPLPPPSQYSLPFMQTLPGPSSSASPNPPSLTSPNSYASSTPSQYQSQSNRLQPLQPWLSRQAPPPPYSQSLPSISAAAPHGFSMPPLPQSSAAYHLTPPHAAADIVSAQSMSLDLGDKFSWLGSLGGDDVLAFVEGESYEQWPSITSSEVGIPSGWLSTLWGGLGS